MSGTVSYRPAGSSAAWTKLGDIPAGSEVLMTAPPQPAGGVSPDGTKATDPGVVLIDDQNDKWRLTATRTIEWQKHGTATWAAAGYSANVALLEKWKATCYQSNNAGGWWSATKNADGSIAWADAPGDPSATTPPVGGVFQISASGFIGPDGAAWHMRGLNASPQDAVDGVHVFEQFPHMNILRLNCNSNNNETANIDATVQRYTARPCVVLVEDHGGQLRNFGWYQSQVQKYGNNPYVFLGTPNEPGGSAQDQIDCINAIKQAGWKNPIGLQCRGGYDFSFAQTVINAVGRTQLFMTPHIYYSGSDPNGSQNYIDADINNCKNLGLWCDFTEFGDGMDGWHRDQWGLQLVRQVIAAQQQGRCGAEFWAMDNNNHPDGCCSAFLTRDGSQLTNPVTGVDPIQPWLRA